MSSDEANIDTDEGYSKLYLIVLSSCGYLTGLDQFGDSFGALYTLFSGLAFAVLLYTIHQQKQKLQLQRLELKQTRDELRGKKEQLTIQNQHALAHYFRNLYRTLKLVHESGLENKRSSSLKMRPKCVWLNG